MKHFAASRCWLVVLVGASLTACRPSAPAPGPDGQESVRHSASLSGLGTTFRVTLYAPDPPAAAAAVAAATERLAEVDAILNVDRPDAEIAKLNEAGEGVAVKLSDDLYTVLHQAQRLAAATHGAFDVTAGPHRELWRQSAAAGREPTTPELEAARLRVGWDKLRLNAIERTATLTVPKMRIDPAGIARGYAADEMFRQLRRHGCERAKVDAGDVVVAGDAPPGRAGWPVRMPGGGAGESRGESPGGSRGESRGGTVVDLTRTAVAFSPNARSTGNPASAPGVPLLIDPLSGRALTDRPAAAVLAGSAAAAESAAAAAPIAGASASQALAAAGGGVRVRFLSAGPGRRR